MKPRNIPIGLIDEDVVGGLIKILEKKQRAPATINRYLATMKTILKHCKQEWEHIRLKKERNGRIRVISEQEERQIAKLLREATEGNVRADYPEVADLVEVLLVTGCRLSEILDLRYEDVNFRANLITIWINKGDRPRSIPMTRRVRNILLKRKELNQEKPFKINVQQVEAAWRWMKKQMGLEKDKDLVPHCLRHSTATRLLERGVDVYTVKEWLGHSSIKITERYLHLSPKKLSEAVGVLE